jgi:hypothetical protein
MIARLYLLLCPWLWLTFWFGGKSSSSSQTSTTYNTEDSRIAASEGASVFQAKVTGSGNVIETVSDDVVNAAFDYAKSRDALAGQTLDNVFGATKSLYAQANDAFLTANTANRGTVSDRTLLIAIAALGALGLGFFALRKRVA